MKNGSRIMSVLTGQWPVERPAEQTPGDDVAECLRREWLYRTDVGNGWVRLGLTPAGIAERDRLVASTSPTLPAPAPEEV